MQKVTYATKVISLGVIGKAVLMGTLVTLLAATSFTQSIILVLVSATATGIFGVLIVTIQVHSERVLHSRMDRLEESTQIAVTQAKKEVTSTVQEQVTQAKEEVITKAIPENGWDGTERRTQ